eukprot:scaffold14430_cov66-Cyclotella_meneghiniana.AAC.4
MLVIGWQCGLVVIYCHGSFHKRKGREDHKHQTKREQISFKSFIVQRNQYDYFSLCLIFYYSGKREEDASKMAGGGR